MGKDIASEQWRSLPGTKPVSVLGALFLQSPTLGGVNGDGHHSQAHPSPWNQVLR